MIETLHEGDDELENFVYVCSYDNQTQLVANLDKLKNEQHFLGDLLRHIEDYDKFDEALAPLYRHRQGRKYISPLSHEEKVELLKDAGNWVVNELIKVSK
jgi:exonuclease SbcD